MGRKTKWVESDGVLYEVAAPEKPKETAHVAAARNDGTKNKGALVIDASRLVPRVQAANGEFLARTNGGIDAKWAIVRLACGEKDGKGCGCGCNHDHAATVLSNEQAALWLLKRGVPPEDYPADVRGAFDAMTV